MIKAIIFDKDGTIMELGETWDEPTVKAFTRLMKQTNMTEEEIKKYGEKLGIIDGKVTANSLFATGSVSEQAEILAEVVPLSSSEIYRSLENDYVAFVRQADIKSLLVRGTEELLQYLKKQGYLISLITNDQKNITQMMLRASDLRDYFDFVGCADEYEPKPNPAALHELSKQLNVEFDEMIYIGDSEVDMVYAKYTASGIGVAFEEENRKFVQNADYIVTSLGQIPAIIEQINHSK
ncbi:HAD family hydrolase [Aerococcaceae bacterium DSM 111020]|nr:HAD family hydrolase [Aerococcaceae bacterium DSM 111020]